MDPKNQEGFYENQKTLKKALGATLALVFVATSGVSVPANSVSLGDQVMQEIALFDGLLGDIAEMSISHTGIHNFSTKDEHGNFVSVQVGVMELDEFERMKDYIFSPFAPLWLDRYISTRPLSSGYHATWVRLIGNEFGDLIKGHTVRHALDASGLRLIPWATGAVGFSSVSTPNGFRYSSSWTNAPHGSLQTQGVITFSPIITGVANRSFRAVMTISPSPNNSKLVEVQLHRN